MNLYSRAERRANAAAEEIVRAISADASAASFDKVAALVRAAVTDASAQMRDIDELQQKGFEAIQLLATPPADGNTLSAEDLRTLLGERLDEIRTLATKILDATKAAKAEFEDGSDRTTGQT